MKPANVLLPEVGCSNQWNQSVWQTDSGTA